MDTTLAAAAADTLAAAGETSTLVFAAGVIGVLIAIVAAGLIVVFAIGGKTNPAYRRLNDYVGEAAHEKKREVYSLEDELEGTFFQRVIEPIINRLAAKFSKGEKQSPSNKLQDLLTAAGNPGNLGPSEFKAVQLLCAMVSCTGVIILGIIIGITPRSGPTPFGEDEFIPPMTSRKLVADIRQRFPEMEIKGDTTTTLNDLVLGGRRDFYVLLKISPTAAFADNELNELLVARAAWAKANPIPDPKKPFEEQARVNRLLLEATFPASCPKNHGMNARQIFGLTVAAMAFAGGMSFILPQFYLKKRIKERMKGIAKGLPDAIDLLVVSVEAGLGFDMALAKVVEKSEGPLSDEFERSLEEMRLGYPRAQALKNIAKRVQLDDLQSFISAIIQADQLGASIGSVLRIQSEGMRVKRRQRVEETAMKAPIKMLFPMVLFIFPTIFIVVLGPIVLKVKYEKAHIGERLAAENAAKKAGTPPPAP